MRIKQLFFLLLVNCILVSCDPFGWDIVRYGFWFSNDSEKNVFLIVDFNSKDDILSLGSESYHINSEHQLSIDSKKPWKEIIVDSIHLYVIDASLSELPWNGGHILTQEEINSIVPESVLARIPLFHENVVINNYEVHYP